MKIIFITNYLSAHQAPLCNALYKVLGDDFSFISLGKIGEARIKLGMPDLQYDYIIEADNQSPISEYIVDLIDNADTVICGNCPDSLIKNRLKKGKLTFKYVERLYKTNSGIKKNVRTLIGTYIHYIRYLKYPFYVLCASAYTAGDINRFFWFKERSFVWGYFPQCIKYEDIDTVINSKNKNSMLWVGRFLDWKHPEIPVLIANRLKKAGYIFDLNIAGMGEMEEHIKKLIDENNLNDCVHLLGSVKNNDVRCLMEKSEIFLFTSDFQEGWGAVLNEAMNSACVCFASHAIGSAPFLIDDQRNGILFENENLDDLYNKLCNLLDNSQTKREIAKNAYETITSGWSEEIAASRLIRLCEQLDKNKKTPFKNGLCSISPLLENDWYTDK